MQSADILLDINEISILATDFHKIPIKNFTKIRSDTNQLTHIDRYDKANSRLSTMSERTQNDLQDTSHTFIHIPLSDMTADQIFRHVLPSVYWHYAASDHEAPCIHSPAFSPSACRFYWLSVIWNLKEL